MTTTTHASKWVTQWDFHTQKEELFFMLRAFWCYFCWLCMWLCLKVSSNGNLSLKFKENKFLFLKSLLTLFSSLLLKLIGICAKEAFLSLQKIEINLLVKKKNVVKNRRAPGNYGKLFYVKHTKLNQNICIWMEDNLLNSRFSPIHFG